MSTINKIKEKLEMGFKLTSCTAARDFLTADLRKYISDLRKSGINVKDRWETTTTGKRYKIYFL